MATKINIGATLPGEAVAVALLEFLTVLVQGQTPEQKEKLWGWYIEDLKFWREFWKGLLETGKGK